MQSNHMQMHHEAVTQQFTFVASVTKEKYPRMIASVILGKTLATGVYLRLQKKQIVKKTGSLRPYNCLNLHAVCDQVLQTSTTGQLLEDPPPP